MIPNARELLRIPTEQLNSDFRNAIGGAVKILNGGTEADVDSFTRGVEAIVREARHVFGELPAFENNTYTFIADYLPWADGDGMEHRNSTILTSSSSIQANRIDLLDTAAHEFVHAWNVERIRPASLEPFDLEEANMSGELWLAEGFTSYYAPLLTTRAGLTTARDFAVEMARAINTVLNSPGRRVRSVVEMSRMAPFVDAATSTDRTSFDNTFISYYTWGAAIGLGLDLELRARSGGRVSLDTFMRALWQRHGRARAGVVGGVERPYTAEDVKAALAEVSGDSAFADEFFARFIEGREAIDYGTLLAQAGMLLRPADPGRAFAGALRIRDTEGGPRLAAATPFGSPAYDAGLDRDDVIVSIAGVAVSTGADVERAIASRKPGESIPVVFERRGQRVTAAMTLAEDPRIELVLAEEVGQELTAAQRQYRDLWLSSGERNTF